MNALFKRFSHSPDSREERLKSLLSSNPAIRKNADAINANRSAIQSIYKAKLTSAMATNDTIEDILTCFFIHLGEYNDTYSAFDVGSHCCRPGASGEEQLEHDLAINAILEQILLAAAAELKMDMNAFKKELATYLHLQ